LLDPGWTLTGYMSAWRRLHTANLLADGKVLVAGGQSTGGSSVSTAELFDPATGTWAVAAPMGHLRVWHTSDRLSNGKILVAGGYSSGSSYLSTTELYDPGPGTWSDTGSFANGARGLHVSAMLQSGKVLVAGGSPNAVASTAEIYDPALGTWAGIASMNKGRTRAAASLLSSGRVLVSGGLSGGSTHLSAAEYYDPAAGTWSNAGAFALARYQHRQLTLATGKVLIAGGINTEFGNYYVSECSLYDPSTHAWTSTGALLKGRYEHTMNQTGVGVMVIGGYSSSDQASTELFNESTGKWTWGSSLNVIRGDHSATVLNGAKILVAGGSMLSSAEIYGWTPTCTQPGDCTTNACADGYCCDTPCTGGCDRCDVTGNLGTCKILPGGNAGSCFPYVCDGVSAICPTSCTTSANCVTGYSCVGSTCLQKLAQGSPCANDPDCLSNFCVDGYCCDSACAGGCDACSTALGATTNGTCSTASLGDPGNPGCGAYVCNGVSTQCPTGCGTDANCTSGYACIGGVCIGKGPLGAACAVAAECVSNFCVDSVCCAGACTGQCAACNAAGSVGTCAPVTGPPVGGRAACATDGTSCGGMCDGANMAGCAYPGSSTTCGTATCSNGQAADVRRCGRLRSQDAGGLCAVRVRSDGVLDELLDGWGLHGGKYVPVCRVQERAGRGGSRGRRGRGAREQRTRGRGGGCDREWGSGSGEGGSA
jgi:hypothetical protein